MLLGGSCRPDCTYMYHKEDSKGHAVTDHAALVPVNIASKGLAALTACRSAVTCDTVHAFIMK